MTNHRLFDSRRPDTQHAIEFSRAVIDFLDSSPRDSSLKKASNYLYNLIAEDASNRALTQEQ